MFFVFPLILFISLVESSSLSIHQVDLTQWKIKNVVDRRFLSFTIDSHNLALHWKKFNISNERFIRMSQQLTPAFLRIGGTLGDRLIFKMKKIKIESPRHENPTCIRTREYDDICVNNKQFIYGDDVVKLGRFVYETGFDLVYGLNVLERRKSQWNPNNSRKLMEFMGSQGIKVASWELGNEPTLFKEKFDVVLRPKSLAKDFGTLHDLLGEFPQYANSHVFGPDVSDPRRKGHVHYLVKFLRNINESIIDKITFHHYYFQGSNAKLEDYIDVKHMNELENDIKVAKRCLRKARISKPLYIGESGDGWGGGTANISDRFAAVFLFLDKLGVCGKNGIQVGMKQTLCGGNYGIIDLKGNPTPSYIVAYLFKKFVGQNVISPKKNSMKNNSMQLRLYFHSCKTQKNSVTMFGLNVSNKTEKIQFRGNPLIHEYLMEGGDLTEPLLSRNTKVNGQIIEVDEEGNVPKIPRVVKRGFIQIPSFSTGIWIIKNPQ